MSLSQTAKEIIRASLNKVGLYDTIRQARGKRLVHLAPADLQDRFNSIYETGLWKLGDPDNPGSGSGSSQSATEDLRRELPELLRTLQAETLLDVGCGDFTWMKEIDLGSIKYIGADIVPSVIEENRQNYSSNNVRFIVANAAEEELPAADVVLIREVLFHLSFDDVRKVLRNVLSKPRRYVLITSDQLSRFNADIRSGDWRLLNLEAGPFQFPRASQRIDESRIRPGRHLGAWKAEDIPKL